VLALEVTNIQFDGKGAFLRHGNENRFRLNLSGCDKTGSFITTKTPPPMSMSTPQRLVTG